MERSSVFSACRSERRRGTLIHAATLVCVLLAAMPLPAGTVTGSVRIEQATIRPDGPKHDRDVVVMLDRVDGTQAPSPPAKMEMDQRGLVFIPHVLAIRKGSTVRFLNNDNDKHNVYFLDDRTGGTLDIGTYGPGVSVDHRFDSAGPVIVLCKLHLEMAAYIVVADSPWFAAMQLDPSAQTASYSIPNVPPGEYRVTVWHKKLKPIGLPQRLAVPAAGKAELPIVLTKASRAKKGK